ncbi:zinc finger BED domain-containing protein RICESLEEPER [Trifolium repens]|nr:zinc finger BED domain-containing protein RICESLEEPER [Trifolium repens]
MNVDDVPRNVAENPIDVDSDEDSKVEEADNAEKPRRSHAWDHFEKQGKRAMCIYCKRAYAADGNTHGTSNLNRHFKICPKNPNRVIDKAQKTIVLGKQVEGDNNVSFKLVEFNQQECRLELAKMIIIDELPFKHVEGVGFKRFMSRAQPRLKIPSRVTIARDCMQLYKEEKVILRSLLSLNHQMVSLTTDTWTSIQNMNYMCVTGHFIDESWELQKKILGFGLIANHRGDTIGKTLEKCLKDWGITKVCTVTVDNASSNNVALSYLIRNMSAWNGNTLLKGECMHLRCCAHILNLIVSDGLYLIDSSISKIRAACKYVKGSPARLALFKVCVKDANISRSQKVITDVATRWNSTYLMLEVASKYEEAFNRLEDEDPSYVSELQPIGGTPNAYDWNRARVFINFLKIFYDATLTFSSSLHVSANCFFRKLVKIHSALASWIQSGDVVLKNMALTMKSKFDKYWSDGNINYLLFVAVYLDPRYKLEYLDLCFEWMYGAEKAKTIVAKLEELIGKLFDHYKSLHPAGFVDSDVTSISNNTIQSDVTMGVGCNVDMDALHRIRVKRRQIEQKSSELVRYKEDEVEDDYEGFDLLKWWKSKTSKYFVLSLMARDILAIPISTVSSESAFSTGGRVLDPYRSSLKAETVEALICTQNWIKPVTRFVLDENKTFDVVEIETEMADFIGLEDEEPPTESLDDD